MYWHLLQLRASLQQRPIFTSLSISQFKKPELQFGEYLECSANASFHIMAVSLRCNSVNLGSEVENCEKCEEKKKKKKKKKQKKKGEDAKEKKNICFGCLKEPSH